jgi:hypothetical protein
MLLAPDESEAAEIAAIMINELARNPDGLVLLMRHRGMAQHFFIKGQNQNIIQKTKNFLNSRSVVGNSKLKAVFIMSSAELGILQAQEIAQELYSFNGIAFDDMVWALNYFYTEDNVSVLGVFFDAENSKAQDEVLI